MPFCRVSVSSLNARPGWAALAPALLLSLLLSLFLAQTHPAQAEAVRLRFALSLIGLPIGAAEARADFEPSRYTIEAEMKLTGVAALATSAKGAATASGSFVAGRVAPAAYATTSSNSSMTRTVRMAMDQGSLEAVDIQPPLEEAPGRIPVTADQTRAIVDPLSALIMPVPGNLPLVGPAACNRTLPVFDGAVRFNITLAYVGSRRMKIHGYDGPVSVCAARYVPISGTPSGSARDEVHGRQQASRGLARASGGLARRIAGPNRRPAQWWV